MNWYKEHRPAIFIFFIILIGMSLIIISNLIQNDQKYLQMIKPVFAGLGGTFMAGGIATLFLNLPRTKEYISNTISNLFTTGEIISSLSEEQRSLLKKKILSKEISISMENIEDSLYEKINTTQNNLSNSLNNWTQFINFSFIKLCEYVKTSKTLDQG